MDTFFPPPPRPYSPYAPIRTRAARGGTRRRSRSDFVPATPAEREAEIARIAAQLARLAQTLTWGRVQNDAWDRLCHFIFRLRTAEAVRKHAADAARKQGAAVDLADFTSYALRRWYCFWGARLAELLFFGYPTVKPGPPKDHEVDFTIDGVPFDLKTSEVPRAYAGRLADLLDDPAEAAAWFYAHQSRERRFHAANRLFLVLADQEAPDDAWRLRGDVATLHAGIDAFMTHPAFVNLQVSDALGQPRQVKTAIIPVLRTAGEHQLQLGFEPAETGARGRARSTSPASIFAPSRPEQLALWKD
jgi:hypothetical protein